MPDFQKLLSRKHTTLVDSILVSAWNDKKRFKKLTNLPEYIRNLEVIDGDFYFDTEWMKNLTFKYSKEKPKFFINFVNHGYKHGERLVKFAKNLKKSNDKPLEVFKKSVELIKNLLVFLPETHPMAKAIETKVVSIFRAKDLTEEKIQKLLLEASSPVKLNGPALEIKELEQIKNKKFKNAKEKERALLAHTEKFKYLGYREPFSNGYDVNFFKKRLNEKTKNHENHEIIDLRLSKAEKEYIKLMREFVYFRNYRTEKLYEALFYLEPTWQKMSESLNLNPRDLFYYLENEIKILLTRGIKITDQIINERKKGYALLLHNDKVSILTGKELISYKNLRAEKIQNTETIKGMAACRGLAKGKVKIILKASEQSKIKSGEILVTSMTTPDFIPCMQKASAFITDEGGITCHAAIVAREMNKPCIIGTKIATKLLKDGNLVEVDANNGIVKILKS